MPAARYTGFTMFFRPKLKLLLFILNVSVLIPDKVFGMYESPRDTIVQLHGYVLDTLLNESECIALNARILLESLPHGNEIGIITSNDSGYFQYHINLSNTYQITITADQHKKYIEVLEPRKLLNSNSITHSFYLEPQLQENQVIRLNKLIFEQGKAFITPESYSELNKLYVILQEHPQMQVQLEGHTDYRGSKKLNYELSQERVSAVKAYLVGKGINGKRIKTKAFGGSLPLVKEQSIEASEINRRVEVRILRIQ